MEPARDAVVRSFARAVARPCARPGCPAPAASTLSFRYASREAWLAELRDDPTPETYDLCGSHADRTRPPHGWQLVDRRPVDAADDGPEGFGDDRTVAVLAAALRDATPAAEPPPALGADVAAAPEVDAETSPKTEAAGDTAEDDEDLAAVLTALVRELEHQEPRSRVEGSFGDASTAADEIVLLTEAVDALQALGAHGPDSGSMGGAAIQDDLPFDEPGRARDW